MTAQYLTFKLDDEVFALEIGKVREVLDSVAITKLPQMPDYMRGVISLRGAGVPVVDLKSKFGIGRTEKGTHTCIIIMEIMTEGEPLILGALADCVQEVLDLEQEQIEAAPKIGTKLDTEYIKGMGKHQGGFVIILDIDKAFRDPPCVLSA